MKFKKTEELQLVFQIYGAKVGADKKPDVTVDYVFYQKDATGEKLFNRTPTQTLSDKTPAAELRSRCGTPAHDGPGRAARRASRKATSGSRSRSPTTRRRRA